MPSDPRPPETIPPEAVVGYLTTAAGLAFVLAAWALASLVAGCSTRTLQAGDLRATETAVLTRNTLSASCAQYGADGGPLSSTSITSESTGDTAMAHELFAGVAGIVGQLRPVPKAPGVPLRQGARPQDGGSSSACVLEHFQGESAPFPPAAPAQPPPAYRPAALLPAPAPAPYRPGLFERGPHEDARRPGHVRVLLAYDPATGTVRYLDPDGRPARLPAAEWARRVL